MFDNKLFDCVLSSQMFKLLCDKLGISGVEIKTGIYTDVYGRAEEHMWCEVTVEGKTYIYDMAQKQVLPKGWSPNPSNPNCGYKEGKVTAPKSRKDKTQPSLEPTDVAEDNNSLSKQLNFDLSVFAPEEMALNRTVIERMLSGTLKRFILTVISPEKNTS